MQNSPATQCCTRAKKKMSGILGIYYLDGSPVAPVKLERMAAVLAHRGPDGSDIWNQGAVGLGHAMLRTTPESRHEHLPLADRSGDFVITADARLDNRAELIAALGTAVSKESTDSQLILAAYLQWGEACPERLLGDFVFAIWDNRRQSLFCARDHFGVRPFYYYLSPQRIFIFASEVKSLFSLPEVPRTLNEERVGDHLADVFADEESTFYSGVLRLRPAHRMTISRAALTTQCYWTLDPSRELRLRSNEEYAERFRDLFTEAVRSRLRSISPIGSMLSGGLDSSSITCVARRLLTVDSPRLLTFSTIFDRLPRCDEREYINAVLALDRLDPHFIPGDQSGPFQDLERIHWHEDQAFYAPNFAMIWKIYGAVSEQGVRVLLDGHDGDSVVSHGYKYLDELAIAGRWLSLVREVKGLARHYGDSPTNLLKAYGWHYGIDPLLARHRSLRMVRRIAKVIRRRTHGQQETKAKANWESLLNREFADRINMIERHRAWRKTQSNSTRNERDGHYKILRQPMQAFALEVHDSAAAAFSIEKRYPFWDKRVVEFCLSLPAEQKLHHGWTRVVMRRAMEDILPKKVQWRGGKMDFTPSIAHGLRHFERELMEEIIVRNPDVIERYVNVGKLRETYRRFIADESSTNFTDVFNLWKCVSLAVWLQQVCGERR
jgi:asparagine synthase (glutamine-hydrolysing)